MCTCVRGPRPGTRSPTRGARSCARSGCPSILRFPGVRLHGLVRSAACAHAAAPQRRRRPAAWPRHVLGAAAHTRPLRPCPPDPPLGPRGAPSVRTPRLAGPASALGFAMAWPLLGRWLTRAVYRARSHRSWFSLRVRPAPCPRRGRGGGGNYSAAAAANSSISTTISSYVSV